MDIAWRGGFKPCVFNGQRVGRGIYKSNDAVNVIGHNHKSIQFYEWIVVQKAFPGCGDNRPVGREPHCSVVNFAQYALAVVNADGNEVCAR